MDSCYCKNNLRYIVLQRPEHSIYTPTHNFYYKTKGMCYLIVGLTAIYLGLCMIVFSAYKAYNLK